MKEHLSRVVLRSGETAAGAIVAMLKESSHKDSGHSLLWTLFPESDHNRDFLYREDGGSGRYLVLSARRPRDDVGLWDIETKPFQPQLRNGDRLAFALRADATVAIKEGTRHRGRRTGLVEYTRSSHEWARLDRAQRNLLECQAAREWQRSRLARNGADLDPSALEVDIEAARRIRTSTGKGFSFNPISFRGQLRVRDAEPFRALLSNGLGRAKAYGFGMILVRRPVSAD
ncbi:type I-E CRISPR-associated protein Cas6/Cse3/CasE [Amorphus sp. 3PC139-8]|uniref:type I-E CRISPR-associated protein Cas6/Cse3/CasE n=1 Tax=Amorphus sp. 3PC139-8 TaxID=2735676 RepID=UPI00345D3C60